MKPKIIAVANTKGGVGKTTVALQLASKCVQAGEEIWFVDGDRQLTAQTALTCRGDDESTPVIACSAYSDGVLMVKQLKLQKSKWDRIIIDVGGVDSSALRAAVAMCDVLVVPFQPRSFDVWALGQMIGIIREAAVTRSSDLTAYAFLNCADLKGAENKEAAEALKDYPELEFIDTPLRRRKAFTTSAGLGLGVGEMKGARDRKAIAEIDALAEKVLGIPATAEGR